MAKVALPQIVRTQRCGLDSTNVVSRARETCHFRNVYRRKETNNAQRLLSEWCDYILPKDTSKNTNQRLWPAVTCRFKPTWLAWSCRSSSMAVSRRVPRVQNKFLVTEQGLNCELLLDVPNTADYTHTLRTVPLVTSKHRVGTWSVLSQKTRTLQAALPALGIMTREGTQ